DARAELVAAYQAQDFTAMRSAAERALAARPGHPGALFNLAFAEVLDNDPRASLETLNRLLAQKVDMRVAAIDEFAPVRELRGWRDYAAGIEELGQPVGDARVLKRYHVGDFIPEGIAVAPNGEVYLGSIRHGDIVLLADEPRRLQRGNGSPFWSVFGMRLVGDTLWFASSAVDQYAHLEESDSGRTGLFAVDLKNGRITTQSLLPDSGSPQVLGDFVVADYDTFYATDQSGGMLYRYSVSQETFTRVVDSGVFTSPQGLVLDASGDNLYVADYVGGIYRVNLSDGAVARVRTPETVSPHGIDGLYRHGSSLIAIQNGIQPNRVTRFDLSEDGAAIVSSDILAMNLPWFDDPNLGQVIGDRFVFIANSHWPRFDREGNLPEGLEGPVILEIPMGED
nr:hypothetical protein [Woeseiaceae bacterium]